MRTAKAFLFMTLIADNLAGCSGTESQPTNRGAEVIGGARSIVPAGSGGDSTFDTTLGVGAVPGEGGLPSSDVTSQAGEAGRLPVAGTGGGRTSSILSSSAAAAGAGSTGGAAGQGGASLGLGGASASSVAVPTAGAANYGKKFVGNITTRNSVDTGGLTFSRHWDQITPENAGKWGSIQRNVTASLNWTTLDAIYTYATANNLIFKEHCFIWGRQQPSGSVTEAAVKTWMSEFCKRYPATAIIDVVNEPPPHTAPAYVDSIGGGTDSDWKWIANAFVWARAACPNATLLLNDYNVIEWSGDTDHMIDIVKKIVAAGAPIDALGAQAHDLDQGGVTLDTVKALMDRLHNETSLPLYITEMDIDTTDDAAQLDLYQQYFPLFMQTEYIKGITIWGWIFGQTWSSAPNSGLIRDGKSRPAMTYLMNELGRPIP